MRYDAAIIGAGGDGLAAAIALADAGLRVIVVDRADDARRPSRHARIPSRLPRLSLCDSVCADPGGASSTRSVWRARRRRRAGPRLIVALWPDARSLIGRGAGEAASALLGRGGAAVSAAALARAATEAMRVPPRFARLRRAGDAAPWPARTGLAQSLAGLAAKRSAIAAARAHLMAAALAGRAADPCAGRLGAASACARRYGVRCLAGAPARRRRCRPAPPRPAPNSRCGAERHARSAARRRARRRARAGRRHARSRPAPILSTLDLKQTFLSLFPWNELPADLVAPRGRLPHGRRHGAACCLRSMRRRICRPRAAQPDPCRARCGPTLAEAHAAWRAGLDPGPSAARPALRLGLRSGARAGRQGGDDGDARRHPASPVRRRLDA